MNRQGRVLLILFLRTIHDLRESPNLRPIVHRAALSAGQTLRILVYVGSLKGQSPTSHWHTLQSFLTDLYGEATAVAQKADNILMDIDIVLRDMLDETIDDGPWDEAFFAEPGQSHSFMSRTRLIV